jgi:hypothetical protein
MTNLISKMETHSNRREFARFIPREQTFVVLSDFRLLGPIKDISLGGVGCEFILNFGEKMAIAGDAVSTVSADIFISGNSFFLKNIPCQIGYDMIASEDRPEYITSVTGRRCGLKFSQLTKEQKRQVTVFLEKHTVGTA